MGLPSKTWLPWASLAVLGLLLGANWPAKNENRAEKATTAVAVKPLQQAPVRYYERNCVECHGANGVMHDHSILAAMSEAQLRGTIREMARFEAEAPLNKKELDVMVAYHRSMIDHKPFVAAVGYINDTLVVETYFRNTLTAKANGKNLPVRKTEKKRYVSLNGADLEDVTLTLKSREGKTTVLPLSKSVYSHYRPLK
jgi:mono/diheme cytochrome c family protein